MDKYVFQYIINSFQLTIPKLYKIYIRVSNHNENGLERVLNASELALKEGESGKKYIVNLSINITHPNSVAESFHCILDKKSYMLQVST